jgi:hypothetical protein
VGPNGVLVWTEAPRLIGQNRTQALRSLFGEVDGTRRSPIAGCYPPQEPVEPPYTLPLRLCEQLGVGNFMINLI